MVYVGGSQDEKDRTFGLSTHEPAPDRPNDLHQLLDIRESCTRDHLAEEQDSLERCLAGSDDLSKRSSMNNPARGLAAS